MPARVATKRRPRDGERSMRMTVLIERLDEGRYRASTSHPITMESEGCSRDEAVERGIEGQACNMQFVV